MSNARQTPEIDGRSQELTGEGSSVRERERTRSSDPTLTLDQRLEKKIIEALALLAKLEPQDARARLLHIAVLRRDESLLDGILAELVTPPPQARRSR